MSDLEHFAAFCQRMSRRGLLSITVDEELAWRLRADAKRLCLVADASVGSDLTIAGVDIHVEEPRRPRPSPEELQAAQRDKNRLMSGVLDTLASPT